MTTPISPVGAPRAAPVAPTDERTEQLRRVARDFESLLVKQLLTAAKVGGAAAEKGGYGDMAVDALATGIEKGGGLGFADRMAEALGAARRPPNQGR
jgi:Rod binding domain-containing protein